MFSLYLDRPARAVLYIVSPTKTRENGTKAAQPVAVCLSFFSWVWFSDKMKAELFTVEVLDVAFICQDVICSRTTHKAQTKCWCESKTWIVPKRDNFCLFVHHTQRQWGMNTVLLLCVVGDWIAALIAEIGVCFWLCTGSAGSCAVQGCTIPNKSKCLSCVPHSLATAHVLTFLLLPSWTNTVTRSHRLPLTLYEWWPFPGLDRKEDRSHLNFAMPPLLNQTPQCQYKCIHTLHPTQHYTDSGRPQQHSTTRNFIQKLIVQAKILSLGWNNLLLRTHFMVFNLVAQPKPRESGKAFAPLLAWRQLGLMSNMASIKSILGCFVTWPI